MSALMSHEPELPGANTELHSPFTWIFALARAVGGGFAGFLLFWALLKFGIYALVLPGALVGIAGGALSRRDEMRGLACAVLAIVAGLLTEWWFIPFLANDGLGYFVTHIHQLKGGTLLLIALGGFAGWWFGRGRG